MREPETVPKVLNNSFFYMLFSSFLCQSLLHYPTKPAQTAKQKLKHHIISIQITVSGNLEKIATVKIDQDRLTPKMYQTILSKHFAVLLFLFIVSNGNLHTYKQSSCYIYINLVKSLQTMKHHWIVCTRSYLFHYSSIFFLEAS